MSEQQQTSESGEKSDESSEKYVIDKPEGDDKHEFEEDDGKRDDSEKVIRADKKIVGEKPPPGWEKHEGMLKGWVDEHGPLIFMLMMFPLK